MHARSNLRQYNSQRHRRHTRHTRRQTRHRRQRRNSNHISIRHTLQGPQQRGRILGLLMSSSRRRRHRNMHPPTITPDRRRQRHATSVNASHKSRLKCRTTRRNRQRPMKRVRSLRRSNDTGNISRHRGQAKRRRKQGLTLNRNPRRRRSTLHIKNRPLTRKTTRL